MGAAMLVLALLVSGWPAAVAGEAILDDFTDGDGWTYPIYQYGNPDTGSAAITDGELRITHRPVGKYHLVSASRTYAIDFEPNTWVHFRFREEEELLGADMYVIIALDGRELLQAGVNGEQHWRMFETCAAKEHDDELFWGSSVIRGEEGGKREDIRVALPPALAGAIRYTDYHVFSLKCDVSGEARRMRLFVEGEEIPYRDLDAAAPGGGVDNRVVTDFQPRYGGNRLSVTFGIFTDGDLYGDTSANEGRGVRWLQAFADMTPAVPHPTAPALAVKRDSRMIWDWVIVASNSNAGQLGPALKGLIEEGRLTRPTAAALGLIR